MKKSIIFSICTATVLTLAMNSAFIASADQTLSLDVKEKVSASADDMLRSLDNAAVYSINNEESSTSDISYDINDAYSVILLKSNPILTYKECGSFDGILSDESKIILPYEGGGMDFSADGEFLCMWEGEFPVMYPDEAEALIKESLPDKNLNVTYTYSSKYSAVIVYIKDIDSGEEYVIPYMYIAGTAEKNLTVALYPLEDFMSAMSAVFEEKHAEEYDIMEIPMGGNPMHDLSAAALFALTPVKSLPNTESSSLSRKIIPICCGVCIILLSSGYIAFRTRRKPRI